MTANPSRINPDDVTALSLPEMLRREIDNWEQLGHPALLQRFVLRNGKAFTPRRRWVRKGEAKACYMNAAHVTLRHKKAIYVEGYAVSKSLRLMPFHHAWVTFSGDGAIDPTLNAFDYEYFGVTFDRDTLRHELKTNGVYGILDPGLGLNIGLMFRTDPELEQICNAIRRKDHERQSAR